MKRKRTCTPYNYTLHFILLLLSSILLTPYLCVKADTISSEVKNNKKLVYLVSDIRILYWEIMGRGIKNRSSSLGYQLEIYSADNNPKNELIYLIKSLKDKVDGIVVSPTTSSACTTILKLAKDSGIPIVIADIGTENGDYISYISSNNKDGAYNIGKILTQKMHQLGWMNGRVGIIAIPQKRINGQQRTIGFMQAINEAGFKGAEIKQQSTFSYQETYDFSKELISMHSDLRAIFIQGSSQYQAVLDAITDMNKKNKVLLVSFDAEPEFLDLISQGILVSSAMQQPYLMGESAITTLDQHLNGKKVIKDQQLPILAISNLNITENRKTIERNVLGLSVK